MTNIDAETLRGLVEGLRQPLAREETMLAWDHWRQLMKEHRSSLPRDQFEIWCELQDEEERFPAAGAILTLLDENAHLKAERDEALRRCERLREGLLTIRQRAPERDLKWMGMSATDIARAALEGDER